MISVEIKRKFVVSRGTILCPYKGILSTTRKGLYFTVIFSRVDLVVFEVEQQKGKSVEVPIPLASCVGQS